MNRVHPMFYLLFTHDRVGFAQETIYVLSCLVKDSALSCILHGLVCQSVCNHKNWVRILNVTFHIGAYNYDLDFQITFCWNSVHATPSRLHSLLFSVFAYDRMLVLLHPRMLIWKNANVPPSHCKGEMIGRPTQTLQKAIHLFFHTFDSKWCHFAANIGKMEQQCKKVGFIKMWDEHIMTLTEDASFYASPPQLVTW